MNVLRCFTRFILEQRIEMLRTEILLAEERRRNAYATIASTEAFAFAAQRRLHGLKSRLMLLERAEVLLAESMQQGQHE